jgi:hypothetical protein
MSEPSPNIHHEGTEPRHLHRLWDATRRAAWCAQAIREYRKAADVRASRSDPGFEIYAGLPLACRMASDEIRPLQ